MEFLLLISYIQTLTTNMSQNALNLYITLSTVIPKLHQYKKMTYKSSNKMKVLQPIISPKIQTIEYPYPIKRKVYQDKKTINISPKKMKVLSPIMSSNIQTIEYPIKMPHMEVGKGTIINAPYTKMITNNKLLLFDNVKSNRKQSIIYDRKMKYNY
jgi:hypothetical protein